MTDNKMISTIKWIETRLEEIETVLKQLDQAIDGYLQWMADNGYARSTCEAYAQGLKRFSGF